MKRTPRGWREVTLVEICEFKYGKSLPNAKRISGTVPVFGSNGVVGYHNKAITSGPTIIIGRKGSFGEVNVSLIPCWPIDTTYYIDSTVTREDLSWLAYRLPALGMTKLNRAAAIPGLNREDAYRQRLLLPPLAEQKRIATILDKADAIRRKRQQAVKLADDFLRATYLDMFGDPVTNPKGWKVKPLGDLVIFKTGKLDSNAAVEGGRYPFFTCSRDNFQIDTYAFDCEALLLAGNNAAGEYSVKYYKGRFNAYQRTYVITIIENILSYRYLHQVLEMKLQDLKRMSKGTNTKYLTLGILKNLQILIPNKESIISFDRTNEKIEGQKIKLQYSSQMADMNFNSLIRRAFRGEL